MIDLLWKYVNLLTIRIEKSYIQWMDKNMPANKYPAPNISTLTHMNCASTTSIVIECTNYIVYSNIRRRFKQRNEIFVELSSTSHCRTHSDGNQLYESRAWRSLSLSRIMHSSWVGQLGNSVICLIARRFRPLLQTAKNAVWVHFIAKIGRDITRYSACTTQWIVMK